MDVQQTEKFCDLSGHIVRVNKFAELNNTVHGIPEDFLITLAYLMYCVYESQSKSTVTVHLSLSHCVDN